MADLRKRDYSSAATAVALMLVLLFGLIMAAPARAEQTDPKPGHTWFDKGEKLQKDHAAAKAPAPGGEPDTHKGQSLADINNKLNNPGSSLAQLNFKFIWNRYEGNLPGSSSQNSLTLQFQPVIPFKLPDGGNLIFRPTIPLVWTPVFDPGNDGFGEEFGLADSQLDVLYSRTNVEKGYLWGVGAKHAGGPKPERLR